MIPLSDTPLPVPSGLADLLQDPGVLRQAWAKDAACRNTSYNYLPDEGEPPPDALRLCAVCPVASQCLATALLHEHACGLRDGWWGGLAPSERDTVWGSLNPAPGALPTPTQMEEEDPIRRALAMRTRGYTVAAMAVELGCTKRTVYRYLAAAAA